MISSNQKSMVPLYVSEADTVVTCFTVSWSQRVSQRHDVMLRNGGELIPGNSLIGRRPAGARDASARAWRTEKK